MEVFLADGHLSTQAIEALANGQDAFTELERLEAAEHLAFCDSCLQRYTGLLESAPLLVPERSCQKSIWTRIGMKTFQTLASRYTAAAAAVALALTILWGGEGAAFVRPALPEDHPSVSQKLSGMTEDLGDSLRHAVAGWSDFFDGFRPSQFKE